MQKAISIHWSNAAHAFVDVVDRQGKQQHVAFGVGDCAFQIDAVWEATGRAHACTQSMPAALNTKAARERRLPPSVIGVA